MSIQNLQGEEKVTGSLLDNISSWQNDSVDKKLKEKGL